MITTRIRLFHLEKILLTESGAWRTQTRQLLAYLIDKLIIEDF